MNLFLIEKWLSVSLFQVSILATCTGIQRRPFMILRQVNKQMSNVSWQTWALRTNLSWIPASILFAVFKSFRFYSGSILRALPFWFRLFFCMWVFLWHFNLILKIGCFSCNWLGFGPFILEQGLFFIGTVLSSFWPGFPRIRLFP